MTMVYMHVMSYIYIYILYTHTYIYEWYLYNDYIDIVTFTFNDNNS